MPKIIDFGVAKATNQRLTQKTVFTEFGQLVGTFEYMSPEQAKLNQLDIDTRSDVYSLGVLLYELLTGTTPIVRERLRSAAFDELLRIIREEEPPKPSTRVSTLAAVPTPPSSRFADPKKLSRLLRGDLDWVVMRALDKERNRRYESAGSFADDIERHLRGEVVEAGPPSTTYRLRKFVHRHRGSVATACAVLLMLVLGLAGTTFGLVEAKTARDQVAAARDVELHKTFRLSMESGLRLCDAGQVEHGMLWLAHSLEIAPPGESAMRRVIRMNLNAWRRRLNSIEMVYPHDGTVISVAFNPRGDVLATGSADGTARLWEVATGRPIGVPLALHADVHDVTFDSSGSRLLTTTLDTTAFLWDVGTGRKLRQLGGGTPPRNVAGGIPAGAFRLPADEQIVTGFGDGTVRIFDAATGRELGRLQHGEHQVHDVVISRDGTRLLTACHDGTAKLWDLGKRELLATFRMGAFARGSSADFVGKDEDRIVTGDGAGTVYLWNVADALADEDRTLEASAGEFEQMWKHAGNVHGLRVGPDRTRIVTGSFDGTARILTPGQAAETRLEHPAPVQNAVFHPDGMRVATASNDGMARVWRPAAGPSVHRRAYPLGLLQEAVYTADGRYLLTKPAEDKAVVRDTRSGEVLCELEHKGAIRAFAVSPDRSMVFTGSADSVTRLFDVASGKPLYEDEHQGGGIWTVAFSPDGTRTLVGDFDGTMEMRDALNDRLQGPRVLATRHPRIQGVTFSPDGSRIAVASGDACVRIVDADDWSAPRKLAKHVTTVTVAKFSSDGRRLVTGSFDKTARVWDVATGRPLCDPLVHGGPISFVAVALSRDGRYAVAGSNDGTARLWDVATSKPIGPALDHDAAVYSTSFTEDGRIMTGTATATISVWDVASAPLEGDVERIRLWLEVATGFELNAKGALVGLDAATWKRRHARLEALGGPPR